MKAKYAGKCKKCDGQISVGESIEWTKDSGARHIECPPKEPEQSCQTNNIPSELTNIQKLSHFNSFGAVWGDLTKEQADEAIKRAARFKSVSEQDIMNALLRGEVVECSNTSWESVADKIRDGKIVEAMINEIELQKSRRRQYKKQMTCNECGTTGFVGEYPFSTNPGSGLCDDCH